MQYRIDKNKVRRVMKANGIGTQTELAERMGISKNQLSVILSHRFEPIKSSVKLLCETLDTSLYDITTPHNQLRLEIDETEGHIRNSFVDTSNIKPATRFTVLELFAGAGGLALGLDYAGLETVGLVELDESCCDTLKANRPEWNVIKGDITEVAAQGIRQYLTRENWDIDLLSGGYPCQSFSYSGNKLGLQDVRGTMFYYYAEILNDLKPKMFLAENVKGLVSHDNGKTLQTMIDVFEEIGYKVNYMVLNALDYSVAQKRERVFIIGIREDLNYVDFKFPKPHKRKLVLRDVLKDVPSSEGAIYSETKRKALELVPPGGYWRDLPKNIAKEYMGKSYYSSGGRTGMARRLSWDEPCLTVMCSPAQKQTERCHPDETRPFTIREYARIQSFPDDWVFCGSMYDQYRQIGNAVPVNLAKSVGLALVASLNEIHSRAELTKEAI